MGRDTSIGWCQHTFNGVHGCAHDILADGTESPGCQHCYAEIGSKRNHRTLGIWGEEGTRVLAVDSAWEQLAAWHRAAVRAGELRRVFCYSIGDVFEAPRKLDNADVCARGRARLWAAIERLRPICCIDRGWHRQPCEEPICEGSVPAGIVFLLLTKRPENVKRMVPPEWLVTSGWPQHVWLGTSVENQQAADERIPHLLAVPGVPVRFLSVEPLLERIDLCRQGAEEVGDALYPRLSWVIAGGESGPRARPCDLAWLRDLRDQARAARVPFWCKQLGTVAIQYERDGGIGRGLGLRHPKGGDPAEWPEDLRVQEVPHA